MRVMYAVYAVTSAKLVGVTFFIFLVAHYFEFFFFFLIEDNTVQIMALLTYVSNHVYLF